MSALSMPTEAKGEHVGRRLARWRLTEPVRLYLYAVVGVLIAGLNLAGYLTGDWQEYAISSAAILLGVPPAVSAARASVYSPVSVIRELQRVRAGG